MMINKQQRSPNNNIDLYATTDLQNQRADQTLSVPSGDKISSANSQSFDFFKILSTLFHRKWTVLLVTLLFALIALLISYFITPAYRANATVEIARKSYDVVEFGKITTTAGEDNEFYSTQYGLLKSPALASKVIKKLKLTPAQLSISREKNSDKILEKITIEELFLSYLEITPTPQSRLVNISFENSDPELATTVTNTLVNDYIQSNMEKKRSATSYTREYLNTRVNDTKRMLEQSEQRLNDYATKHKIIKFDEKQETKLATLKKLEEMLAVADGNRIDAKSKNQQFRASAGLVAENLNTSPVLQTLKLSKAQLDAEYQEKLQTYKPSYPGMLQIKKRLNKLASEISKERNTIISQTRLSTGNRYKTSNKQVKKLAGKVTSLKRELMGAQNKAVEFNVIKREVSSNQNLYNTLLKRLNEVTVASDAAVNNISIINKAYVPKKKIRPRRLLNLAAGTLLGLFTGSLLALFLELTRGRIRNEGDIKKLTRLPLLGSIPTIKGVSKKRSLLLENRSSMAEAFRSLRTNLTYAVGNTSPSSILITSSSENEGKSTTAINLASAYVRMGKNVLLIDGDMRRPSIGKHYFDFKNELGLTDYLKNVVGLKDVIKPSYMKGLSIIPVGKVPNNPVEILASNKMVQLVKLSQQKFDMVIIDSPPVLDISDSVVMSSFVDATILVVKMNTSRINDISHALNRLQHDYSSLLGIVATHTKARYSYYGAEKHRPTQSPTLVLSNNT
ncbi:MAG: polysaccharide biosynthesis tyrosine autokinase [Thiotrichaceae bacterium]